MGALERPDRLRSRRCGVAALTCAAALVATLAACSQGAAAQPVAAPASGTAMALRPSSPSGPTVHREDTGSEAGNPPRAVVVTRHLDAPWGLAFLPGGGILVGERDRATILLVHANGSKQIARRVNGVVPNGNEGGEAGLLGLALSPHFARDHWVYAYLSSASDNRVVRMRWRHHALGAKHLVFKGIPRSLHHNGGRIAFGPDKMLYVTTGDAEVPSRAQNRSSLGGKILRMTPGGRPAPGNPFRHSVVYSYGHRNVEGLDWDSSGRLWASEFGDHTFDELNLVRPGHDYGWPVVEGVSRDRRFTNPKTVWHTDNAGPSGIAITRPHGRTVAFVAALTGQRLWRVAMSGSTVVGRKPLYVDTFGRIRTTAVARGSLWFTTSNTDGRATPRVGDDKLVRVPLR